MNGILAPVGEDGVCRVPVPFDAGDSNVIIATCTVVDSCGVETVCTDTITVFLPPDPVCTVSITTPEDSLVTCGEPITVMGMVSVTDGIEPIDIICDVNGVSADVDSKGAFITSVPLDFITGDSLVATCTVTDACGNVVVCADTAKVSSPPPLICSVEIVSPVDSSVVCKDSLMVTTRVRVDGGLGPFTITCDINGITAGLGEDGECTAMVPFNPVESNVIVATCTVVDSCGSETVCSDTITVFLPPPPVCTVSITTPEDSLVACDEPITVKGMVSLEEGIGPFSIICDVNGVSAEVDSSGTFIASVTLDFITGDSLIATCTVTDACGNEVVCADTAKVSSPPPVICSVEIVSPEDSSVVCVDSLMVTTRVRVEGGTGPFTITCDINTIQAEPNEDGTCVVMIPFGLDESTTIVATCTVVDSCGNETVCSDTVKVFSPLPPLRAAEIVTPQNGAVTCSDSIAVRVASGIGNGNLTAIACEVNGFEADRNDDAFRATIPLSSGENLIVATCTFEDACGRIVGSSDSVTVFLDDIPPSCTFAPEGTSIVGSFFDTHSGIGEIVPTRLRNANLVIDPFTVGDKVVDFRLEPIDPNKSLGFVIDVFDTCGNRFNCDPVFVSLSTDATQRQFDIAFPSIDRYLQLTNFGLSEIRFDLNGNPFSFFSDLAQVETEVNGFYSPRDGKVTI
ncbi:hypothetical protein MJD09_18730, partial [bacterium]|nr:hypothetical protein [bacterium]